ncbi:MAG: peptidylprolyl isomerase [Bacteroidaceae bacterium]|nr:peptidylprolyl isomerase [Bacteroidaceae bacterium]
MRNKFFLIICPMLLMAALHATAQDNVIDEVVWVVGDEAILKSDVENTRRAMIESGQRIDGDPYAVIPEQIAVQKLFLHQAAIDSIDTQVTDAQVLGEVDKEINRRISSIGSQEKLEQYLGKTIKQQRDELREQIRDQIIVQLTQQSIVGDIKLTPSEVRRRYDKLSEDEIPYVPTEVEVQIITQEPEVPQEEIDYVKQKLRDITERIQSGETTFAIQALINSKDGSAMNGGELPFYGKAEMVPEFAAVAFSLTDPNKISKIVETEFGYHIIQLIEKRGDRVKVRHILMKPTIPQENIDATLSRLDSIADDIRNGKFSFDEGATAISMDKDTRANFGIMSNPNTLGSRFEMSQLPQEVAKAIYPLNVGEISKPFTMVDQKTGKEICAIVKLKTKVNGHKATVQEDFQTLKDMMIAELSEEKLEKWIVEKQKTTYIRINDSWKKKDEFKYPGWIKD